MFWTALSRSGRPIATTPAEVQTRLDELFPDHPSPVERGGRRLVAWVRLDNRADLLRDLGCDASTADDELLLAAYDAWGVDCPDRLEGDFAFVIVDEARHTLFGARDASGIRPFHYALTADLVAVAASGALLLPFARDGVDVSVRSEWLARYVHGASVTWDETPWPGIATLPPGHSLEVTADDVRVRRWHEFRDDPPWETDRDPHWLEDYRDQLHEAVRARIRPPGPIGVETSGGIDSSTILALAATLAPERLHELHGFAFVRQDMEPEYALETSRVHRVPQTHVFSSGQPMDRAWEPLGHPPEHGNSTGHIAFYKLAQLLGVRTLLSGHGGDELVTNQAGLAMLELLDHRAYAALWRDLQQRPHRKLAWILRERLRPGWRTSPMAAPVLSQLATSPLSERAIQDAGIEEILRSRSQWEAPYRTVNGFALGDRLSPSTSVRTAEGSLVAAAYGIDYAWPLLDRRLVQQWLSTPAVWKFAEGTSRYLHRRAAEDVVPHKVIWKPDKHMASTPPDHLVDPVPTPADLHPALADLVDPRSWQARSTDRVARNTVLARHRVTALHGWLLEVQDPDARPNPEPTPT